MALGPTMTVDPGEEIDVGFVVENAMTRGVNLCHTVSTKRKEVVQLNDKRIGTLEVAGR